MKESNTIPITIIYSIRQFICLFIKLEAINGEVSAPIAKKPCPRLIILSLFFTFPSSMLKLAFIKMIPKRQPEIKYNILNFQEAVLIIAVIVWLL